MQSKWLSAAVPLLAIMLFGTAKTPTEVEITSEPSHHLVLQNRYVRVFQVEVAPGSATLLHRHRHDYVFVSLGSSEISNEVQGKSPVTLKLQAGETRFTPGDFAHIARNLAVTPFRAVAVEFLQDENEQKTAQQKWTEDRGLHVLQGGTEDILFVKDGVRVSQVDLQIAGSVPKHRHASAQLVVAVTDLELRSDVTGQGASNLEMKSGEVKWVEGGFSHTLTNVGKEEAKLVTLEFQ